MSDPNPGVSVHSQTPAFHRHGLYTLLLIPFVIILLRNAWVVGDAFITFRTVDNFVCGRGLTWNVAERVQSYTHPLWMLIVSLFYFVTREAYFTSLFLSLALAVLGLLLVMRRLLMSDFASLALVALLVSS